MEWCGKLFKELYRSFFEIAETSDIVYIGKDLPDEYVWSEYTKKLKGTLAKAKANAVQGIPEMVEIATDKSHKENLKYSHRKTAESSTYRKTCVRW